MAKAFKEWEGICDALGRGDQDVILRKGGIHEGREGFSFGAEKFFLFPTRFHGQGDNMRVSGPPQRPEWEVGDEVEIRYFVKCHAAQTLTEWDDVTALADRHVWTEKTIRERFDWEGKGMPTSRIHCAEVKVYELAEPFTFIYERGHGGCRSWVEIPEPPQGWDTDLKEVSK